MTEEFVERLKRVLLKHRRRAGSWLQLMNAIDRANDNDRERRIDRRVLERICLGDIAKVQLRIQQLAAIDRFFVINNEAPLFTRSRSLISSIAESLCVNFLVGANHLKLIGDDAIARWDLRAVTHLMRTRLNELQVRIWDICAEEEWSHDEPLIVNYANVSIGSPVANGATEIMGARMIGVTPNEKCDIDSLPFCIIGAARDRKQTSAFIRDRRELRHIDPRVLETLEPERRGIAIGTKAFVSTETRDYGLILAQRSRANGQAQVVLCGLTGQATCHLGAILRAGEPSSTLPPLLASDRDPPILIAVYEFTLTPDEHARGRNTHRVISYSSVVEPSFLQYRSGRWQLIDDGEAHD